MKQQDEELELLHAEIAGILTLCLWAAKLLLVVALVLALSDLEGWQWPAYCALFLIAISGPARQLIVVRYYVLIGERRLAFLGLTSVALLIIAIAVRFLLETT